jgi:hypothetical protein
MMPPGREVGRPTSRARAAAGGVCAPDGSGPSYVAHRRDRARRRLPCLDEVGKSDRPEQEMCKLGRDGPPWFSFFFFKDDTERVLGGPTRGWGFFFLFSSIPRPIPLDAAPLALTERVRGCPSFVLLSPWQSPGSVSREEAGVFFFLELSSVET